MVRRLGSGVCCEKCRQKPFGNATVAGLPRKSGRSDLRNSPFRKVKQPVLQARTAQTATHWQPDGCTTQHQKGNIFTKATPGKHGHNAKKRPPQILNWYLRRAQSCIYCKAVLTAACCHASWAGCSGSCCGTSPRRVSACGGCREALSPRR